MYNEANKIRRDSRAYSGFVDESYCEIRNVKKNVPKIIFSKCTKKQALEASFFRAKNSLQEISAGDLSKISYLKDHMKFMDNSKLCNDFFSIFPFDFFMNQIVLDSDYSLDSLEICAKCIKNKNCPPEFRNFVGTNMDLAKFLCSTILPKNNFSSSKSCFKIFTFMALSSVEIRDFLLESNVIQKIHQFSENERIIQRSKYNFLIESTEFIFHCLIASPISNEKILNDILKVYLSFLSNKDELVVAHSIKLLKKMRKIEEVSNSYSELFNQLIEYITEHYSNSESTDITLAVYSFYQEIDSIEYLNLTLEYLQNSSSQKVIKKCLKTMCKRSQQWSSINNEEICQILIKIAQNSSFIIQKLSTKVLVLYWDKNKMIDKNFFNLLTNFLNEKDFGIVCMNVILTCLNDSFSQDEIKNFVDECWDIEFESLVCNIVENGEEDESNTASMLVDAFRKFSS